MSSGSIQETQSDDQLNRFIEEVTRLQTRFPTLVRSFNVSELYVDVVFYIEDLAIQGSQALLDAGVTAVHRLDHPKVISFQIPSLKVQQQYKVAVKTLAHFLDVCLEKQSRIMPHKFDTSPDKNKRRSQNESIKPEQ